MGNECKLFFCSCYTMIYFFSSFTIFVAIIAFLVDTEMFTDGCTQDLLENSQLNPITDIYLSSIRTEDTIKLGYLEEYESKGVKVFPSEIYKWENKYINVKRDTSAKPINYIFISNSPYSSRYLNVTTMKFNNNKYLHYTHVDSEWENDILYDLKVSFREQPYSNKKKNSNICFSHYCLENNGTCYDSYNRYEDDYKLIDNESTYNFIRDNNIEVDIEDYVDYYEPEAFYLFKRGKITEGNVKSTINLIKKIYISFIIFNLVLRVIKLVLSCFLKVGDGCCSCLKTIYVLGEAINFILLLIIFIAVEKYNNLIGESILEGLKFSTTNIYVSFIAQVFCFFHSFFLNFYFFSEEPHCCSCGNYESPEATERKNKALDLQKKINEVIQLSENKLVEFNLKLTNLKQILDKIEYDKRMINVNSEKIIFSLHLKKKFQLIFEKYNNISERIEELENKLIERQNELEEVKEDYNKQIFPEINTFLKGKKIKLNCVYLDENINAEEDFCSSYEFFKILKNTLDGVFFGIKTEKDYYYLNAQIPEELKFVLIYSINDKEKAYEFLNSYHSKFINIIIFTVDPKDFWDLKDNFNNIISIESDYSSLLSRLNDIEIFYDESVDKYKPYDLNLYSDYLNNNKIQECHKELLRNTQLGIYTRDQNLYRGLSQEQCLEFISFLDNDLDDGSQTAQERREEEPQINVNLDIEKEELENNSFIPDQNDSIRERRRREENRKNINLDGLVLQNIMVVNESDEKRNESRRNENRVISISVKKRGDPRRDENNETIRNENDDPRRNNNYELRRNENRISRNYSNNNNSYDNEPNISPDFQINFIGIKSNINESSNKRNQNNNPPKKVRDQSQASEDRELVKNEIISINVRPKQKEYLGKIDKTQKEIIKQQLTATYKKAQGLLLLYTFAEGKFYQNLNNWLRNFNLDIYKKIGPISGKIMNFLYLLMKSKKNFIPPEKLYRGFTLNKADIFLYKACEGDIFFYPAFTSTSTNPKVTDIFKNKQGIDIKKLDEKCNCLIEIDYKLRNGDVLQEAEIREYSEYQSEDERLFPPNSFFKIKRVLFNDGYEDGRKLGSKETFDGTFEHPFKIELEIIRRNFYLDEAIIKEKNISYNKEMNIWELN